MTRVPDEWPSAAFGTLTGAGHRTRLTVRLVPVATAPRDDMASGLENRVVFPWPGPDSQCSAKKLFSTGQVADTVDSLIGVGQATR